MGRSVRNLNWASARVRVKKVNAELAKIIDDIDPPKHYQIIKATYQYGDLVIDNGVTQLPNHAGNLLPAAHQDAEKIVKQKLNYNAIPLLLTLKNDNEVFLETCNRVIPLNLFHEGNLLGLFESINFLLGWRSQPKWSVSAGARSIFMLPKITDNRGFDRLRKRFEVPAKLAIQNLQDHWDVFKYLAQHPTFQQPWENEILFFTQDWLKHQDSPTWKPFFNYLFKHAWQQTQFAIGKIEQSLSWEKSSEVISLRNIRLDHGIIDQVKHILLIASGRFPAFRPPNNNSSTAPIDGLQEAFVNSYLLKPYLPTLMHTQPLDTLDKLKSLYYSLSFPTLLEGSPTKISTFTIMTDLKDIQMVLDTLRERIPKDSGHIIHTVDVDYFHVEKDSMQEILSSKLLPEKDSALIEDKKRYPTLDFCYSSLFWRGCLRIKKIKT